MSLNQDAAITGDKLQLTSNTASQNGSAWLTTKQYVASGFSTDFNLGFNNPVGGGADGIAFSVQNTSQGASRSGDGETGPSSQALTVSFNSWNGGNGSSSLISVISNGTTLASYATSYDLSGHTSVPVRVSYTPGDLDVYFDINGDSVLQPNELIFDSLNVSLNSAQAQAVDADGKAWVGFTSRTGGAAEVHTVNSWTVVTENKVGPTLTLGGANTYTGPTNVNSARLIVAGSTAAGSPVSISNGSTLGGSGVVAGSVTVQSGGSVAPGVSTGILTTNGNFTLSPGAALNIDIAGTGSAAGTDYDQVRITGSNRTVTLTGATLVVGATVEPSFGTAYRIIDNTSTTNVVGTFAGLPEGAYVGTNFGTFQISYVGGTGNDVTLTLVLTTEVSLDGSGNLVIADLATGGQDDNLTIQSDTANSRFIITDMTHTLGITGTIAGATLTNNAHTIMVPFSSVSGNVLVDTRAGNDSLTIDLSLGNFSKTVTYDGGSQTTGDSLSLVGGGPFATVTHGLTGAASGTIDVTGNSRFSYANVEPLADRLTATNRVFNFQGARRRLPSPTARPPTARRPSTRRSACRSRSRARSAC